VQRDKNRGGEGKPKITPLSQILGGVNVGMKTKSWASVVPPPLQTNPKNWDQIQRPPSNMLIHVDISPSPPPQLKSYKECAGGGGVTKIPYIKWLAMNWFHSNGIFLRINSVYILTIMHILCMWDIELYCSWTQHIYDHQYHS
jgi:hypothetical protein